MSQPAGWEPLPPSGLSAAILGVTISFTILATVVLGLRVATRLWRKVFAVEDWLMCAGYIINIGHNAAVCYGTFTGLGVSDKNLPGGKNGPVYKEGLKAVFLWQILYLSNFVFIKSSICLTLLRIALVSWHRKLLWAMIITSVLSTVIVDIFILTHCQPISGAWHIPEDAYCLPSAAEVSITFIISGFTLATDFATALLPYVIIKDLHMPARRKKALVIIMGVGLFASFATLARLPFAKSYFNDTDYLIGLGHIIFWTVIECDLALILGCIPMLHRLVKGFSPGASRQRYNAAHSTELVTIGHQSNRRRHDVTITAKHQNPYQRNHDDNNSSESAMGITVEQELRVSVREDRASDRNVDSSTTHQAKTYV